MTTKYYVRVAIPYDPAKQDKPQFHNLSEFLEEEGNLRCCDTPGHYMLFTEEEAHRVAQRLSEYRYITEVLEEV
ncbi:hypothetical protein SCREM1_154 [Synechococcus phage S-CREM1]|nr:hypothetical protein SCREM1_154 [Synechococcus phage S-CREM1]